MNIDILQLEVEALIFASENGVKIQEILDVFTPENEEIQSSNLEQNLIDILKKIEQKYNQEESILELKKINGAFQFLTKPQFHDTINRLQTQRSRKKLTQSAMETLAIIAYRQPITKLEIEHIRGVNCDYSVQRLLEKDLISIVGKAETVGKPILYGTSAYLMDYFGLNDPSELPQMKELETNENRIGETAE